MGLGDRFNRWVANVPQEKDYIAPDACEYKDAKGHVCGETTNTVNVNGKILCIGNNHHKIG